MRWFTLLLLVVALCCAPVLRADEKSDAVGKQKERALEVLKKCEIDKPGLIETKELIACGPLSDDKLKAMAVSLDRHYVAAVKSLKFEASDPPFKGKLTVYLFPERKVYSFFVSEAANERLDKTDRGHADGRSDTPYVAASVLPGEKPTDLDAQASLQMAVALFQVKVGPAKLPSWMTEGFIRSVQMRNNPAGAVKDRAIIKQVLYETPGNPAKFKAADVWAPPADIDSKEKQLISASLMEYLVFGRESAKFGKLLSAMRGGENGQVPITEAMAAAGIAVDKLDASWKRWVMTGK